jgi:hypothetical protein
MEVVTNSTPVIRDGASLVNALRRRKEQLGLPYRFLDETGGFAVGYTSRILNGRKAPSLANLETLFELLGVSIVLVPDIERQQRAADRWDDYQAGEVRSIRKPAPRWQGMSAAERSAYGRRAALARWQRQELRENVG